MIPQQEFTAQDVRQTMQTISQEHLSLEAKGYTSTSAMLIDVLLKAASDRISIDAACRELEGSVSANRIRELLNEQLTAEALQQVEDEINDALSTCLPKQMFNRGIEAAIDEHDEPYYGDREALAEYVVRSKAKAGTTRFFRIITLYAIYRQMRVTVAVVFVLPEVKTVDIVQRLLLRAQALKLQIRSLYLDRGYCCGSVITYLQRVKQPAILACTIRGKQGGTRQLCRGRKSYRTCYTFTDGTAVQMAVVATLTSGKRQQKRRRKWLLYVAIGLNWQPQTVHRRYRSRFGIESSYRILRRVRVKTSSRNPALRFFLLGFALLLVNVWARLRWVVARIPGPGPHRVDPLLFQFQLFVSMLRRAVEQFYGAVMLVPIPASSLKL